MKIKKTIKDMEQETRYEKREKIRVTHRSGRGEEATMRSDLKWIHDDLGDDDDGEDEEVWDRRRTLI